MKKNGRPKLEKSLQRKLHSVKCYCTEEEKKQIIFIASQFNFTVSEYLLIKSLDKRVVSNRIEMIASLDTLNLELFKGGNNINQLAKHANRIKNANGLDQTLFMNFINLLNIYVKKTNDIKSIINSIYRELAK
ncbi:plasmid mobilization protein [Flavobacterium sp. W1B]|uniref:plasmid mobilization protein n=1 Tax=Flavobacterium sp. W1B TaxID=3394146 RepID=UPI0039BD0C1D